MSKFHFTAMMAFAITIHPLAAQPAVVVTTGNIADRIRSQNPDLSAARLQIREAMGRLTRAGRPANPELETAFEQNSNLREGRVEIGISQRFPVAGRLLLEKEISLSELKAAEAEVREVERQLIGRAREMVVKIMASRQRRELLHEQAAVASEFADLLAKIVAQGEASALDAVQARLESTSLAAEIRQLDANETSLVGELKPLLGILPGESLNVSGRLLPPTLRHLTADPAKRPDFQAATLNAQAAAQEVKLEQARRYQDVEGGFFAAAERVEDAPEGFENEALIGLRFKIPLPFWNDNQGAILEAEARRERRNLEAAALSRGIRLEAEAEGAVMIRWKRLIDEIDTTLLPLANEQNKLAWDLYRQGQGDIQSVLRSRQKLLQISGAKLDALCEFHLARIRHESALGTQ